MNKDKTKHNCSNCSAFGKHCPHKVNGDPYHYDCAMTVEELEEKLANADYQLEGRDNEITELKEEIRQLKNEVEDLRGYCNQIGKVKIDVLKAFEHIVAK